MDETPTQARSPVDEPILRRLKAELERLYGDRLERVLLYGSRARGDARPDSDWDVAVFLRGYDGRHAEWSRLSDLAFDILLETGIDLSLQPFAPEELPERTPIMHEIRREGVPL
jgi:predicted nucleotidyltransferase